MKSLAKSCSTYFCTRAGILSSQLVFFRSLLSILWARSRAWLGVGLGFRLGLGLGLGLGWGWG